MRMPSYAALGSMQAAHTLASVEEGRPVQAVSCRRELEPFAPRGGGQRPFVFHKYQHHQTGQCVCVPRAGGRDAHAPSRGAQPRLGTVQGPPRGGHPRPQDLDRVHSPGDARTRFAVTEPLAYIALFLRHRQQEKVFAGRKTEVLVRG